MEKRDQPLEAASLKSVIAKGGDRLRRDPLSPIRPVQDKAQLDLPHAVQLPGREPAPSDQPPVGLVHDPRHAGPRRSRASIQNSSSRTLRP